MLASWNDCAWRNLRLQPKTACASRAFLQPILKARSGSRAAGHPAWRSAAQQEVTLRGREFDYEAVAPAVLGVKERLDDDREPRLAVIVHDACDGVELSVADPDLYLGPRLDVAHPIRAFALGNKVEVPAMLGEPDLDFSRADR